MRLTRSRVWALVTVCLTAPLVQLMSINLISGLATGSKLTSTSQSGTIGGDCSMQRMGSPAPLTSSVISPLVQFLGKVNRATRRRDTRTGQLVDGLVDGSAQDASRRVGEEAPSPLSSLIEEEVRARVVAALESLPENQRVVMELSLKGLATAEIARLLDLNPAAVRKRESRATERLRELLQADSPPE